ncbi:MAG: hypothetical protein WCJ09_09185 [Planctomycetota bacterium]
MNFRDDLFSVLKLGWESSRRAWRLLAPGQETTFTPESVGSTGRDLDQLAYDLRRLGHGKPARMAFSIAFILNGLAVKSIQFDRDLADKASQIIGILAEMLLELESNTHVTTNEPVEIVEELRERCGLVAYADDETQSQPPRPHFGRTDSPKSPDDHDRNATFAISEQLVDASQSLLNRVIKEGQFPYVSTLSRIHHLGTTLRDQLAPLTLLIPNGERNATSAMVPPSNILGQVNSTTIQTAENDFSSQQPIPSQEDPSEWYSEIDENERDLRLISASKEREDFGNRPPLVFIIDDSPFFRMLLTSAIESDGYAPHVVANIDEAKAIAHEDRWDLLICGSALIEQQDQQGEWLRQRIGEVGCPVITLVNIVADQSPWSEQFHQVRRTDLSSLRSLIRNILGPVADRIRMSA